MNAHFPEPLTSLPLMEFEGDTKLLFPAFIKAQAEMGDVLKKASNPAFKSGGKESKSRKRRFGHVHAARAAEQDRRAGRRLGDHLRPPLRPAGHGRRRA
jgi:hypothetical protein